MQQLNEMLKVLVSQQRAAVLFSVPSFPSKAQTAANWEKILKHAAKMYRTGGKGGAAVVQIKVCFPAGQRQGTALNATLNGDEEEEEIC